MMFARTVPDAATAAVGVADMPESLSSIRHPECAAAIWQRTPMSTFQAWIDALPPEQLPKARMILRPERIRDALADIMGVCDTPDCPERALLTDDAAAIAAIFARVMDAPYLRLRLDVITGNACRKFHIDAVTARLVCTYRGTGTQYGFSRDNTEPPRIFTVPTGAPIVLRGTLWPETPKSGLVHRSPPIEGSGETRLLLVLDPVTDLESEPDTLHDSLH
jgi:hypothetical protein